MLTTAVQGRLCGGWLCTRAHRHAYTLTPLPAQLSKLLQQLRKESQRNDQLESMKTVWGAVG